MVKPKKSLGQHFLIDMNAAEGVANGLTGFGGYKKALEVGPGTGVLSQYLFQRSDFETTLVELDRDSVAYLKIHYPELKERLIEGDFLELNWPEIMGDCFAIVGNFPYNISSQILFSALDMKDKVPEVVGMFQKEVADRVCAGPGSKTYGIISILLQAFYNTEYLFTVEPQAFNPPPKVRSAVIRLQRNDVKQLPCDEKLFIQIVKTAFNQRRKTLRNTLKKFDGQQNIDTSGDLWGLRPEQLSVEQFINLTLEFQEARARS
jgi:16S rRNA (adenine1518-N6/adenine1519-N6)-dimethyltransferase